MKGRELCSNRLFVEGTHRLASGAELKAFCTSACKLRALQLLRDTRECIMAKGKEQQLIEPRQLEERLKMRGSDRIQINNFLGAISIAILSVLLSLSKPGTFGWIFAQLAVAVPCFITSSLAYTKMTYRGNDEYYI